MAHRYLLACFVFIFCRVDGESLYGLKGLSVSLKPDIPGKPTDMLWKHNGNKLVEFNGNEEHVYGTFKNRITLDWHTADIEINDLRFEDSGNYELEATINNKLHPSLKTLVVIEEVPKPTISCKMNDGSSSNKSGTLECSAESKDSQTQFLMKFEWKSHGHVQPGPQLTISLGDEHDDHKYICNVRNPMSSNTTTFTAKDCYPDKGSSVALAAGLVILFLIIFVVLGIVFCHRTHKACFAVRGDDVEEQSPPTESLHNTTAQTEESQPLLHTTAANQPPGMTVSGLDVTTALGNGDSQNVDEAYQQVPVKDLRKFFDGEEGSDGKMNKGKAPPVHPSSKFDKGDQLREPAEAAQSDPTDPEKANQPDPAVVSADLEEDKKPHQESSTAPEEQGLEASPSESGLHETTAQGDDPPVRESEKDQPKEIVEKVLHNTTAQTEESQPLLHTPVANQPPGMTGLDVTTALGNGDSQNVDEAYQQGLHETTAQGDDPPVRESEKDQPSKIVEKELKKEAEKDEEANVPSNVPSVSPPLSPLTQNSPNVVPQNTAGEESQDMDKPISTPEKERVNEEIDEEKDPYGDTSKQPQSPIQTNDQ